MKLTLYIQPGAVKTKLNGVHDGMARLSVAAPPVEGAANKAVTEFIAETLGLPKSSVKIVSGKKSRIKTVQFDENKVKYPDKIMLFIGGSA